MTRALPVTLLITLALLISACNPLDDAEPTASPGTITQTTATGTPASTLAPMTIVTPTPIDPRQIPATASPPAEDLTVPATYVVQEGDSLYSIAIKFQLDLSEIVALNGLSDPNDIEVGQELQLPVPEQ